MLRAAPGYGCRGSEDWIINMRYIVFDLEWNQCPNGKSDEVAELPFEIFEIGAVKLDDDMLNIPLFMADEADRLIGLALEHKSE